MIKRKLEAASGHDLIKKNSLIPAISRVSGCRRRSDGQFVGSPDIRIFFDDHEDMPEEISARPRYLVLNGEAPVGFFSAYKLYINRCASKARPSVRRLSHRKKKKILGF